MISTYRSLGTKNVRADIFLCPLKKAYIQSRAVRDIPARTCFSTTAIAMTRPVAKVAICQICSTEDVEHNLHISKTVIRDAVRAGAKVSIVIER
jgi:hypothetical protein